jgi:hypothetical protein
MIEFLGLLAVVYFLYAVATLFARPDTIVAVLVLGLAAALLLTGGTIVAFFAAMVLGIIR